MYQQIKLSDLSLIGAPGPLPYVLQGASDTALRDLSNVDERFDFGGTAFWPVVLFTPSLDPATQALAGTVTLGAPDPATHTVPATADLRALTADEIAATLAAAQAAKLADLAQACATQILAGYTSAALGAVHTYPAKDTDQANMTASVVDSIVPGLPDGWTTPFWCADAEGTWSFQPHTATQIQQAGRDGKATILAAQAKLAGLKAQVAAATTVADVFALTW